MTTTDLIYEALRTFRKEMREEVSEQVRKEVARQLAMQREYKLKPVKEHFTTAPGGCSLSMPNAKTPPPFPETDYHASLSKPRNKIEVKAAPCDCGVCRIVRHS